MKPFFFLLFMVLGHFVSFAQSFKVKEFKMNLSDLSASTQQRTDATGLACGLVKVQTKVTGVEFGGNAIGNVENKTNEYWVYLPKGTKEIVIMRPDYLPLSVNLAEYGVDAIDSKTTYTMVLKEVNLNPEKCGVAIHVKPREAQVRIDDIALKQNSSSDYKVLLPKGDHLVRIDAPGHRPDIKQITTGKGVQDINVELESLMADINIISQTSTADIFVDEKSMGVGGWKGKMMPGKHVVEVRQKGFVTATNQVTITEKEQRTITIPKLSPITGSVKITTSPEGCTVFLDGEEMDKTPCTINHLIYGEHQLVIKIDSCGFKKEKTYDIQVLDDKEQNLNCVLINAEKFSNYSLAYEYFLKGLFADFGGSGDGGYYPVPEAKIWFDKVLELIDDLDSDFFIHEYNFQKDMSTRELTYNSPIVTPAMKMIVYYLPIHNGYAGYDYDEKEIKAYSPAYPEKAAQIVEKVGIDYFTESEIFYIAFSYLCANNLQKADYWFQEWEKVFSKKGFTDDYPEPSNEFFCAGVCYKKLNKKKEAIRWFQKSLNACINEHCSEEEKNKIRNEIRKLQ